MRNRAALLFLFALLLPACTGSRVVVKDDLHWRVALTPAVEVKASDESPQSTSVEWGTDMLEFEGLDPAGRRALPGAVDDRIWSPEMGISREVLSTDEQPEAASAPVKAPAPPQTKVAPATPGPSEEMDVTPAGDEDAAEAE